jgi:hypothetical protein
MCEGPLRLYVHLHRRCAAGAKFYEWLRSWNWDLSVVPAPKPQDVCLQRYDIDVAAKGGTANVQIDACACDAIVTDCHMNAQSPGSGTPENSGPFNVYNGVGNIQPPMDPAQRSEWWNAADPNFPSRSRYATSCRGAGAINAMRLRMASNPTHM